MGHFRKTFLAFAGLASAAFLLGSVPAAQATTIASEVNSSQFVGGVAPSIGNNLLNQTGYQVCYQTFCSVGSQATLGTVWTAEHLTADQVNSARGADRNSLTFFPDPHIPASASATLSDYTRTGYDKGHMAPWADNADRNSFSFINVLPQNRDNNRRLWEGVETTVRNIALYYGEVYVVSGPIFEGNIEKMRHRIAIPTGFYKAIYVPSLHLEGAYIVRNAPGNWWLPVPVQRIVDMTHTTPFPALPVAMLQQSPNLPLPNVHGRKIQPGDNTIPAKAIKGPSPFDPPAVKDAETNARGDWTGNESDGDDNGNSVRRSYSRPSASHEAHETQGLFRYIEGFGRH